MIIFSFKKCVSESGVRKVKKIYLIISIVLFIVAGLIVGLISKTIIMPMYEGLGGLEEDNFDAEQTMQKFEEVSILIRPISFIFEISVFYITIWAMYKLGMGKIASIIWGIVALAPFVGLIPFIIILTRKFSPNRTSPITQK